MTTTERTSGQGMRRYNDWTLGDVGPVQTLRALCMDLGEVESEIATLNEQRDILRAQISEVVGSMPQQRADVPNFGRVLISAPAVVEKFDTKRIAALIEWLDAEGKADIAERLVDCRTKSMRVGGLRIEREK